MKKFLEKYKLYLIFIVIIFTTSLFLSLLNLIGVPSSITNILSIIIFIITYLSIGFVKGKQSNQRGYLQGIKIGITLSLILFILGLFTFNFSFKTLIYYLILILSSIFGATLGINKKK